MSGEMEAAGALTTAGLAAGAIEGREVREPGEGACLNCGAQLTGPYCAQCGQAAHPHRTLAHLLGEFLQGLWNFDTKVWRTLPMLIGRPGTLTRNYVYGKRARYVSPLAMFLLTIFAMFFVFALAPSEFARVDASDTAALRSEIGNAALEAKGAPAPPTSPDGGAATWQDEVRSAAESNTLRIDTGIPAVDARLRQSLLNPDLALYKIQEAASKYSFLMVPLALPFMWLLFVWKRGVTLYDHVVFTLYGLCFASVAFMAIAFFGQIGWGFLSVLILGLGLPAHMFFHLKGAYALGWWSAIWRTAFLLIFSSIVLALFVAVVVILGLVGG